ncbi:MAG: T9SS C-terminal target domain-containing protein [Bacteroidetes bacterium]|nr:MAG: T9SS C-terminal target domain-containing protein [Bacteroidota bacterium]TAG88150.1 MAG: T9SS C-terminal target domain-containing protein [Bacteroidota bacterium]
MKKNYLLLIFFVCFINLIQAQISSGGTPFSFGSHFREKNANAIAPKTIVLASPSLEKLIEDDQKYNYSRFAAPIAVNFNMENSGTWTNLFNGDRIWRLKMKAEGAWCLRPLFDNFDLPKGGKMFIYNEEKTIIMGAFTDISHSNKMLGTEIIEGNNLTIEYYEPKEVKNLAKISLFRVDYGYRRKPAEKQNRLKMGGNTGFGDSGSCNINVNCALGADWQDQKKGVVKINLTSINGSDWCTGSMINNTALDRKAYLLSADHCLNGQAQAFVNTWVFIFNYESSGCANGSEPSKSQSISGATVRASRSASDMLLLELSSVVPVSYNTYYNGWSREIGEAATSVGIHHPRGDIKKISKSNVSSLRTNINYANLDPTTPNSAGTHFQIFWDATNGITEPSSSGSPIFDPNKRIIGQLHGGASACGASANNLWDVYGRVYSSWTGGGTISTRLSDWLDPTNTGVFTLNGLSAVLPSSIENTDVSNNIKVYPNPATDFIYIETEKNADLGKNININIFSNEGKNIEEYTMNLENNENKLKIKINSLPKGTYYFRFDTKKGVGIKKIVIE